MSQTHLHLVLTHLLIYGTLIGTATLVYGMATKSIHTKLAAYYIIFFSALGGIIAFTTGEAAEETVERIQGVNKNIIEQHEDIAKLTLTIIIGLGVVSLSTLIVTWKRLRVAPVLSYLVLILSIAGFAAGARTGYLGGQIRHTEIGTTNAANTQDVSGDDD